MSEEEEANLELQRLEEQMNLVTLALKIQMTDVPRWQTEKLSSKFATIGQLSVVELFETGKDLDARAAEIRESRLKEEIRRLKEGVLPTSSSVSSTESNPIKMKGRSYTTELALIWHCSTYLV